MSVLTDNFQERPSTPKNGNSSVVNYVWINKVKAMPNKQEGPLCAVSLTYIDKALENAGRYPQADFVIWLDYAFLDGFSRFFVESRIYCEGLPNVSLRNLQDIAAYRENPLFSKNLGEENIWQRTDLARLLVLGEYTDNPHYRTIFYADFDIENVKLEDPACTEKLDKHGMVFALDPTDLLENGFMGFRRGTAAMDWFTADLIPHTIEAVELRNEVNGYYALNRSLLRWCRARGISIVEAMPEIGINIAERTGFASPANSFYEDCQVN